MFLTVVDVVHQECLPLPDAFGYWVLEIWPLWTEGGGGGTQNVPKYEGSNPTSTVHPPPPKKKKKKKKKRISDRPKNILNFNTPKNIPILFLELKKRPENT